MFKRLLFLSLFLVFLTHSYAQTKKEKYRFNGIAVAEVAQGIAAVQLSWTPVQRVGVAVLVLSDNGSSIQIPVEHTMYMGYIDFSRTVTIGFIDKKRKYVAEPITFDLYSSNPN